jgi:hypothetical protein
MEQPRPSALQVVELNIGHFIGESVFEGLAKR